MAHVSELIGTDIEAYLEAHEHKSLLRFITCGSVDDGKSTLIGRLLYDSKMIFEDQLAALEADSKKVGTQGGALDFALLVDGLAAEREQGITIDVAYRFFSTDKRKFIVADTPGHEQYTRNMVTGASTADLAVILIDARKGVLTQTRRHSYIVSLLGIRHVVLAVNKMDLVDCSREIFDTIVAEYRDFARQIKLPEVVAIPVSGLRGDNIKDPSTAMPWYHGPTLDGASRVGCDRGPRDPRAVPASGAVGQPPEPGLPGFCGDDRERGGESRRQGACAAVGAREPRRARSGHGRGPEARGGRSVGHDHARGRDRCQPRRRVRGGRLAARGRRPVRDHHHLDERRADASGPAVLDQDRHEAGDRDHHRAQVQGERQHARAPGREDAGA